MLIEQNKIRDKSKIFEKLHFFSELVTLLGSV